MHILGPHTHVLQPTPPTHESCPAAPHAVTSELPHGVYKNRSPACRPKWCRSLLVFPSPQLVLKSMPNHNWTNGLIHLPPPHHALFQACGSNAGSEFANDGCRIQVQIPKQICKKMQISSSKSTSWSPCPHAMPYQASHPPPSKGPWTHADTGPRGCGLI